MNMNGDNRCPRCEGRLQSWGQLNDEDQAMVQRLPSDYSLEERKARHRWCTRCWFEDSGGSPTLA